MLQLFRSRHPIHYITLFLYTFVLNAYLYFERFIEHSLENSFIFSLLKFETWPISDNLLISLSLILLYFIALQSNRLLIRHHLTKQPSFVTAYIVVTLFSFFPESILLNPSNIALFGFILTLEYLLPVFDIELAVERFFFIGFFVGIFSLIYAPASMFLLFVVLSLPILKRPTLWEAGIIPIGFFVPVFLIGFYFYIQDQLPVFINLYFDNFPYWSWPDFNFLSLTTIPVILIAILSAFAFMIFTIGGSNTVVRENLYQQTLSTFFVVALVIYVFSNENHFYSGSFVLLPALLLISRMFADGKRKILDIVFITLLVVHAFLQWQRLS